MENLLELPLSLINESLRKHCIVSSEPTSGVNSWLSHQVGLSTLLRFLFCLFFPTPPWVLWGHAVWKPPSSWWRIPQDPQTSLLEVAVGRSLRPAPHKCTLNLKYPAHPLILTGLLALRKSLSALLNRWLISLNSKQTWLRRKLQGLQCGFL